MDNKIDFVIAWVDGNDEKWLKEREKYANVEGNKKNVRYRDWDNLKYWFRGVEKYAPWVNKIFFVTWGHVPEWLDINNPKLVIVNHKDFIPKKYLPTFNSNTIDLNLFRIKDLSENFVYFNDDMFIIDRVCEDDFFKENLPRNAAVLSPVFALDNDKFQNTNMNNMLVINNHFNKKECMKRDWNKWFSLNYGKDIIKNVFLNFWDAFAGFMEEHNANSYNKSTYIDVWEKEKNLLDKVCSNKFRRVNDDVNQWLMKYWQICSGKFAPRKLKNLGYFEYSSNNDSMYECIKRQQKKLICINDVEGDYDFEKEKKKTIEAFEVILNEKSSFEK